MRRGAKRKVEMEKSGHRLMGERQLALAGLVAQKTAAGAVTDCAEKNAGPGMKPNLSYAPGRAAKSGAALSKRRKPAMVAPRRN